MQASCNFKGNGNLDTKREQHCPKDCDKKCQILTSNKFISPCKNTYISQQMPEYLLTAFKILPHPTG